LIGFAWIVWKMLPNHAAWQTILAATATWLAAAIALWFARKRHMLRRMLTASQVLASAHRPTHHRR
jgi:hypothetical protein